MMAAQIRLPHTDFYPRPPRGGRPLLSSHSLSSSKFLSTSSARRTTQNPDNITVKKLISIHVLREEDDGFLKGSMLQKQDFYPRPPRGGRPYCYGDCMA